MTRGARLTAAVLALLACLAGSAALAKRNEVFDRKTPRNPNDIVYGGRGVTGTTVVASVASLILPGLGQIIDQHRPAKAAVHFILGIPAYMGSVFGPVAFVFGLWHVWSAWDALIDRPGGYIDGLVGVPQDPGMLDASTGVSGYSAC